MSNVTENTTASGAADKPEALRLAEELMIAHMGHSDEGPSTFSEAADELRRLHALAVADADRILAEWRAYKPAPLQQGEYLPPPEPDTHCYDEDTGKDVWSHSAEQMRAYVDAHLAARGAAQAAPADQRNTKTHDLLSTMIGLFMGQRHKIGYKDNSVIAKVVAEAVEHLKDWPYPEAAPAPVAEGFDEWLEKQFEFRNYYFDLRGPGLMAIPFARRAYEAGRAQAAQPEGGA